MNESIEHLLTRHTERSQNELTKSKRWNLYLAVLLAVSIGAYFVQGLSLNRSVKNDRLEPFVMVVDKLAGEYKTVMTMDEYQSTQPENFVFREAIDFAQAWERFDPNNRNVDFYHVQRFATPGLFQTYVYRYSEDNPESLYTILKNDTVDFKLVSFMRIGDDAVQIEYQLTRTHEGTNKQSSLNYIARLNYALENVPKSKHEHVLNPMGFRATAFTTALKSPLLEVAK
jgi:type IV secretory pathway component VirB8